jgi:hypothetical protein
MTRRLAVLAEMESAHQSVSGTSQGSRFAAQQINQAYAVLLCSHFQGYCRDLHGECLDHVVTAVSPAALKASLREVYLLNRKLDTGNPNAGNIGSDFGRFGLVFWGEVLQLDARNQSRRNRLEELNRWRNAIAHQDFDPAILGSSTLRLQQVRTWRRACEYLASAFDEVMRRHLQSLVGTSSW